MKTPSNFDFAQLTVVGLCRYHTIALVGNLCIGAEHCVARKFGKSLPTVFRID